MLVKLFGLSASDFLIKKTLHKIRLWDAHDLLSCLIWTELFWVNFSFWKCLYMLNQIFVRPCGRILWVWFNLGLDFLLCSNLDWPNKSKCVLSLNHVWDRWTHVGKDESFAVLVWWKFESILENQCQLWIPIWNMILLGWIHCLKASVSNAFFKSHETLVDSLSFLQPRFVVELSVRAIFWTC